MTLSASIANSYGPGREEEIRARQTAEEIDNNLKAEIVKWALALFTTISANAIYECVSKDVISFENSLAKPCVSLIDSGISEWASRAICIIANAAFIGGCYKIYVAVDQTFHRVDTQRTV